MLWLVIIGTAAFALWNTVSDAIDVAENIKLRLTKFDMSKLLAIPPMVSVNLDLINPTSGILQVSNVAGQLFYNETQIGNFVKSDSFTIPGSVGGKEGVVNVTANVYLSLTGLSTTIVSLIKDKANFTKNARLHLDITIPSLGTQSFDLKP